MVIYGIKNCDTVKKALRSLDSKNLNYEFHDFKKLPPTKNLINKWLKTIDWQTLVNQRGLTWRRLPEEIKQATTNKVKAIELMLANPSIIKRPILENGDKIIVGYDEQVYNSLHG